MAHEARSQPERPASAGRAATGRRLLGRASLLLVLAVSLLPACDLPRDPNGTLDRVRGGTLRVGVVHEPPWARVDADGSVSGVEVRLVEELARELDAEVRWIPGSMPQVVEALVRYELDLVIGGVARASPGISGAATTNVYLKEPVLVGARSPAELPADAAALEGSVVRVPIGSRAISPLEEHGAEAELVVDLDEAVGLVAAPKSLLLELGYHTSNVRLAELHRLMLVAPGENGFLVRLETFLHRRRSELQAALADGSLVRPGAMRNGAR